MERRRLILWHIFFVPVDLVALILGTHSTERINLTSPPPTPPKGLVVICTLWRAFTLIKELRVICNPLLLKSIHFFYFSEIGYPDFGRSYRHPRDHIRPIRQAADRHRAVFPTRRDLACNRSMDFLLLSLLWNDEDSLRPAAPQEPSTGVEIYQENIQERKRRGRRRGCTASHLRYPRRNGPSNLRLFGVQRSM